MTVSMDTRGFHIGDSRLGGVRLFDARVKILSPRHQCENPYWHQKISGFDAVRETEVHPHA